MGLLGKISLGIAGVFYIIDGIGKIAPLPSRRCGVQHRVAEQLLERVSEMIYGANESVPQRLKPQELWAGCGTAESRALSKPFLKQALV